jgi:hypothetical protein
MAIALASASHSLTIQTQYIPITEITTVNPTSDHATNVAGAARIEISVVGIRSCSMLQPGRTNQWRAGTGVVVGTVAILIIYTLHRQSKSRKQRYHNRVLHGGLL